MESNKKKAAKSNQEKLVRLGRYKYDPEDHEIQAVIAEAKEDLGYKNLENFKEVELDDGN